MKSNKLVRSIAPLLLTASLTVSAQMSTEAKFSGQAVERFSGATVLFDQLGAASNGNGIPDQNFETAFDAYDSFAADDFVIDGENWSISQVDTIGTTQIGGADSVSISFHEDLNGAPNPVAIVGCEYIDTAITGQVTGAFNVVLPTPCDLAPGTYWLAMQTNQEFGVNGQHFWSTTETIAGAEAHWLNPADGFARGCTEWSPAGSVCGVGSAVASDLLFSLSGDSVPFFSIGGNVSGLSGTGLTLQNNGGDDLSIAADGGFTFATALADLSPYEVTVLNQPGSPSQTCSVTNDTGTLAGSDVTNVDVTCSTDTFTVGGTVTGLLGTGLTLQNNGDDDLSIAADGVFTFATALTDLSPYAVTVLNQPGSPSQTCSVTNDSGALAGSDVTNVDVTCTTDTFTVGGTVSGLLGTGFTLQNNGGDDLSIAADGVFTFATALTDLSPYAVTVLNQPGSPNQICTVSDGSGTLAGADVSDVTVTCITETYFIGGILTGMLSTNDLLLDNNEQEIELVNCNGPFVFDTPLDDLSTYSVLEAMDPDSPFQDCEVTMGDGTINGNDIIDIFVSCAATTDMDYIFGEGFDCSPFNP